MPPCLTQCNIMYASRVKWSNPGKGVAPYPTHQWSSYWKGSLLVTVGYGRRLYLLTSMIWWEQVFSSLSDNKLYFQLSLFFKLYCIWQACLELHTISGATKWSLISEFNRHCLTSNIWGEPMHSAGFEHRLTVTNSGGVQILFIAL